ncbi:MAG: IS21 family transposase, partial [Candidatus Cloacimonetes bacterium]|nr:IS21 family transposase [Candidatus Cloacimonadota bacterium]
MTYYKEILLLSAQGISVRNIALSLSQSRNTVAKVLKAAAKQDLRWPTSDSI